MSESWWPINYCYRYPERCAPPYDGPPHYPKLPLLAIADSAPPHLGTRRAAFWALARDNALQQWEALGFDFLVREGAEPYRRGRITINVTPTHDGTRGQADFGALPEYPVVPEPEQPAAGVAYAHVDDDWFEAAFRARNRAMLVKVLTHEIGHTLGYGHHNDPSGVMSTYATGRVNDAEIAAGLDYWGRDLV